MLETITKGFSSAKDLLRKQTTLSDENISNALKEVRHSLLEADVEYSVVKNFIERVRNRALGLTVKTSVTDNKGHTHKLTPSEHFIGICYEELESLMGRESVELTFSSSVATFMMVGLQGSGKTTSSAKLAKFLQEEKKKKPLLVAADIYRPGAVHQLKILGERLNVPVFHVENESPQEICRRGLQYAHREKCDAVIFDTAGRLAIDEELMAELDDIKAAVKPEHIFLVVDAMIGQDAVNTASLFDKRLDVSGFILTKLDGDARGGAAISIKEVTNKPIRFLGMGEDLNSLEPFRAQGLASRILGMGDVVSLAKDFEKHVDEKEAEEDIKRLTRGSFSFDDFLKQMSLVKKLGSFQSIMERIPGMSSLLPAGTKIDEKDFIKFESMIFSMTKKERATPELLVKEKNRRVRIANGCGRKISDLEQLLERFMGMRQMMQVFGKNPQALQGLSMFKEMGRIGEIAKNYGHQDQKALLDMMGGMGNPFAGNSLKSTISSAKPKISVKEKRTNEKKKNLHGRKAKNVSEITSTIKVRSSDKIFVINPATVFHTGMVIFAVVIFFLVSGFPLLGTVGFESANFFVALFAPLFLFAATFHERPHSYRRTISVELSWLFIFVLVISLLMLVNGFTSTSCSQGAGFLSFLFVLIPPFLLNISIGVLIARLIRRPIFKIALFIALYGAYFSLIIFCWWQDPNFRLITHGSLLITSDLLTGDVVSPAVLAFRTSTFLLSLAIILFGINFLSHDKQQSFRRKTERPILNFLLIILILFFHAFLHMKSVEAFGKNKTALKNDYTLMRESDGLRIFTNPIKTSAKSVERILDEARYFSFHIKKQLGTLSDEPVTIWLHASEEDKFLYTGAKNVHFALPKHREIHITGVATPHDVLGHELAHIYVGELSKTLIGVPGAGYFIPNLALTEGIAVLLTKVLNIENNLTIYMQAQALYQADIRLDIEKLFSSNPTYFAMAHPRSSYIYSGATLDYFLSTYHEEARTEKLRQLIREGTLDVFFESADDKSQKIAAFVQTLSEPVPPYAVSWAHKTFKKTSILTSDCSDKQVFYEAHVQEALEFNDVKKIEELLMQFPPRAKSQFIASTLDQALLSGAYTIAIRLIEHSDKEDASEKAELMLKNVEALINLDKFDEAWTIMENVDEQKLPPFGQRLVEISQIFFRDYSLNGFDSVGKAALSYLFSRAKNQPIKLNNFIFRVGKASIKDQNSSSSILMSYYLLARVLMRYEEYQQAKNFIIPLIKNQQLLPKVIDHESKIMFATINVMLRDFNAALDTFTELLASSTSPAEKLYFSDQRARIFFEQMYPSSHEPQK